MKTRTVSFACLAALCLFGIGGLNFRPTLAQTTDATPPDRTLPARAPGSDSAFPSDSASPPGSEAPAKYVDQGHVQYVRQLTDDDLRRNVMRQLEAAKKKLNESRSDERADQTATIKKLLDEYFQSDMAIRRTELDRLEYRADATEALLEKRQSSREELIDLQVQAIAHDAEGLGLFGSRQRSSTSEVRFNLAPITTASTVAGPLGLEERQFVQMLAEQRSAALAAGREYEDARKAALEKIATARADLKIRADAEGIGLGGEAPNDAVLRSLEAALGEYFDADMKFRRAELAKIRTGLQTIQRKLAKRQESKADIIALQLKIIVHESEGLGFFRGGDDGANEAFLEFGSYAPGLPAPGSTLPTLKPMPRN